MDKKEFVLKAVADKKDLIVEVSDKIFDYAETGFHEFKTAKLYEDVLKKELDKYTRLTNYKERCYARVLSVLPSMMQSIDLGFSGKHLIAMQGPFSREMNLALLHQTEAKYFVTKESGKNGGFAEKLEAAEQAGAVLLVIGRPIEEGLSVEEAEQEMRKWNRD